MSTIPTGRQGRAGGCPHWCAGRWVLLAFMLAAPLAAQQPLSLTQAVRQALDSHPGLEAAGAGTGRATEGIREARSGLYPRVRFSESLQRSTNPVFAFGSLLNQRQFTEANFAIDSLIHPEAVNNFQSQLQVEQVLFDFGRTGRAVDAARLRHEMAGVRERGSEADVILRVVQTYFGVRDLRSQLEQAEAGRLEAEQAIAEAGHALSSAQAQLALAQATHRRYSDLVAKESVSRQEFDEVDARLRGAEAAVEMTQARQRQAEARRSQAEARIGQAQVALGYARIEALSGLHEGEKVVLNPSGVRDGQAVHVERDVCQLRSDPARRVTRALAERIRTEPEVTDLETYVGTASPYNFNGLVRHYFLRQAPHQADIQVNLVSKHERDSQSHDIAKRVREKIVPIARQFDARIAVAEVPPGPPVLQTLVAEVYGPDQGERTRIAGDIRGIFERTRGIVDVDWYVEQDRPRQQIFVDEEKAALHGISEMQITQLVGLALSGQPAGLLHDVDEKEDVPITLRLPRAARSRMERLRQLRLRAQDGSLVPLSELTRVETTVENQSIYHKNLLPVTYVTADLAGAIESPVYAVLQTTGAIVEITAPGGYHIEQYSARLPFSSEEYAMKWDGEWHITYEVFRDLGLAFAVVLILIYVLVVGWFESFLTPLVIMSAIPFSLVGILPAHGLLNAFFTATSMIGFIAGAGIVVRNSIILVDFVELRRKQGIPLDIAVIDAGAVRFRPMMLTAAAVVVGAAVILFDPIFQGLAIALMAGEIASLALSRMTVPIVYYMVQKRYSR